MKYTALAAVAIFAALFSYDPTQKMEEEAWTDMCNLARGLELSCEGIEPPLVIYEEMDEWLLGYYEGGDTVFVNIEAEGLARMNVLIHEMVHYLHWSLGIIEVPDYAEKICRSEYEAFLIDGVWWWSQGFPEEARPNWWTSYPHCWEFYAPQEWLDERIAFIQLLIDLIEELR